MKILDNLKHETGLNSGGNLCSDPQSHLPINKIEMKREFHIDLLSVIFGIGTWVCVNGLWVELPLLVRALPESWNLPSYLTIMIQLANLGPILYTLLHSLFPSKVTEVRAIYLVIFIGFTANTLILFYWSSTSFLFNAQRSTALLTLVFFLALVDCSSRVLYLPFMARFKEIYLTSFFIGEGLSGFIPSIFALIQGVGGNPECILTNVTENGSEVEKLEPFYPNPLFSIETFFILLLITTVLSFIAFHLLTYRSITKNALVVEHSKNFSPSVVLIDSAEPPPAFYDSIISSEDFHSGPNNNSNTHQRVPHVKSQLFEHLSKSTFIYLLILQALVCALSNGAFPSIQSYSCLPYGNVAYHWAVTLSTIANPSVCFLLFILPKPTQSSVTMIAGIAFGVSVYVMSTAVMSPTPPLVKEKSGEVLLVSSWILLVGLFTYVKVSIATILRDEGKRGLLWCGAITQVGSALGSFIMFFLVNYATIFNGYFPCQDEEDGINITVSVLENFKHQSSALNLIT